MYLSDSDDTGHPFASYLPRVLDSERERLLRLMPTVDHSVRSRLRTLAVITATGGYAYQREDGVSVIPITALGP